MDPEAPLAPVEPRRPGTQRAVAAVGVVVVFLAVSLGYHDGLFWTDSLAEATTPGNYRFKGVIAHYDPMAGTLLLRDGDEQRTMVWNITVPDVGRVYVVDAQVISDTEMEALALSPVFLFR